MNILFLGTYLSNTAGTKGPGEFVSDKLNEAGYSCQIVSRRNTPLARAIESLWAALTKKYDIAVIDVYSSRIVYLTYLLTRLIRFREIPYIPILHGGAIPERYYQIKPFLEPILKHASKAATPSNFIRQFFEARDRQLIYLPNPFPIENFSFHPQLPGSPLRLLWVRAFSPVYNPDLAVRILAEVRKTYPEASLTMVGPDKGILAEVLQLIREQGLNEAVTIVGSVANDRLFEYYQNHSVYLNTTSYESFGLAVMEAAACGIPILSTKVGEIPLLWENNCDILIINSFNPTDFALAIGRLQNNPELALNLALNARKKAETFDWDYLENQWIKLLNEA